MTEESPILPPAKFTPESAEKTIPLQELLAKAEDMKGDPIGFEDYICYRLNQISKSEAMLKWAEIQGKTSPHQNTRYLADRVLGLPIPTRIDPTPSSNQHPVESSDDADVVLLEDLQKKE
jgi:hypothetical protein